MVAVDASAMSSSVDSVSSESFVAESASFTASAIWPVTSSSAVLQTAISEILKSFNLLLINFKKMIHFYFY